MDWQKSITVLVGATRCKTKIYLPLYFENLEQVAEYIHEFHNEDRVDICAITEYLNSHFIEREKLRTCSLDLQN